MLLGYSSRYLGAGNVLLQPVSNDLAAESPPTPEHFRLVFAATGPAPVRSPKPVPPANYFTPPNPLIFHKSEFRSSSMKYKRPPAVHNASAPRLLIERIIVWRGE